MTQPVAPSHAPQGTVGHAIVEAYLDRWLDDRKRTGRRVPKYVERELRAYLRCGDPERFTTLACPAGHFSRFLAGRCKGRAFCAYCLTLRRRDLGHRLIERVIGNVPVRHVVLCFPPHLRQVVGYSKALLTGGFSALAEAVFEYQRRKAEELFHVPRERIHPGGVLANHRTSANLDTNHHFHGIFPDGVFVEVEPGGDLEFRRLPAPTEDDIAGIAYEACRAFCEVLEADGFWKTTSTTSDTVEGILTLPKRSARPVKFFGQAARDAEGGVAPRDGAYAFHVFVGNAIELEEHAQLEYLVAYILAPPFRDAQLELDVAGNVVLRLKRERHDGTAHIRFTPYEFLDRLAELVGRRNANTVRYYGIYAPRARLRKRAVALRVPRPRPVSTGSRPTLCPICSARLRVVAVVTAGGRPADTVPPDTPQTGTQRGKDRFGRATSDDGQGRLFG